MDDCAANGPGMRFPAEITFKSIFVNRSCLPESILGILSDCSIQGDIQAKESRNGKFISFTVTALFSSKETLDRICTSISTLDGFIMMF